MVTTRERRRPNRTFASSIRPHVNAAAPTRRSSMAWMRVRSSYRRGRWNSRSSTVSIPSAASFAAMPGPAPCSSVTGVASRRGAGSASEEPAGADGAGGSAGPVGWEGPAGSGEPADSGGPAGRAAARKGGAMSVAESRGFRAQGALTRTPSTSTAAPLGREATPTAALAG